MKPALHLALLLAASAPALAEPPTDWIDPATGHRVLRLSRESGSASLYFHQNAYTSEGDKLLISTPSGLTTVNLTNRSLELVVPRASYSMGGSSGIEGGRKSRQVYYGVRGETGTVIRATHLDTKATRDVVNLPFFATVNGINADETLLLGTMSERGPGFRPPPPPDAKADSKDAKEPAATPPSNFGSRTSLAARTNLPRAMKFYSADLTTGERIRYSLARSEWSVHCNVSWDGKLFAGDGGGPDSVANQTPLPEKRKLNPPGNGQWIYLFRPQPDFKTETVNGQPVKESRFEAEKLVDLSKHDYNLEPNVTFAPDGKWLVFRSNMHGERHVYAVEVASKS
jgi:hypothetical protein